MNPKRHTVRTFVLALLITMTGGASSVVAQSVTPQIVSSPTSQPYICTISWHNLYLGLHDSDDNQVTSLQNFLASQGYLSATARGYFGSLTLHAVMHFQRDNDVSQTGYFGNQSRSHMMSRYCNTSAGPVTIQSITPTSGTAGSIVTLRGAGFNGDTTIMFGSGALIHISSSDSNTLSFTVPSSLDPLCRYSSPACAIASRLTTPGIYQASVQNSNGTSNSIAYVVTESTSQTPVTIYSITPSQGPTGTVINITGFGFTSNNTVRFGIGGIGNIPITSSIAIACTTSPLCHGGINQTLQFTIPSSIGPYCPPGSMMMCAMYMQLITPGTYTVYVQNDNGTSNSVTFTVTDSTTPVSSQTPTITGVDTPSTIPMGTVGSWTVHATVPNNTSNLHYSVNWSDQNTVSNNIMAPRNSTVQSSATFTHSYSQSGTYTQQFTVTDDNNHSATVSTTVTITPWY